MSVTEEVMSDHAALIGMRRVAKHVWVNPNQIASIRKTPGHAGAYDEEITIHLSNGVEVHVQDTIANVLGYLVGKRKWQG